MEELIPPISMSWEMPPNDGYIGMIVVMSLCWSMTENIELH